MHNNIIKFRLILWTGLFLLVCLFLYLGIVPFGKISYHLSQGDDSFFIGKLSPKERMENETQIIGDPVYFSLYTPRSFNKAKVKYRYKFNDANSKNAIKNIESGILVDKLIWRYDLKPVINTIIDERMTKWRIIKNDDLILLQREDKFSDIKEFLNDLPDLDRVAMYNYDLNTEYLLSGYASSSKYDLKIEHDLRGPYQFYTYIKKEELNFKFLIQDLNQNLDKDDLYIHLYYNDSLIIAEKLDDDGIESDEGNLSDVREVKVSVPNLPEGVYKLELRCGDDIITRKIETKQTKLAFISNIRFYKASSSDFEVFTDSNIIYSRTINPDRLQTLKINDEINLELKETYSQFDVEIDNASSAYSKISIEKDGIVLAGNGVFSFSEESLLNPTIKKVDKYLNLDDIDYILAKYSLPKMDGEWMISEINVDLKNSYREDNKYNFIISIPGLKIDDEEYVEISDIWIDLDGRTIFEKVFNRG